MIWKFELSTTEYKNTLKEEIEKIYLNAVEQLKLSDYNSVMTVKKVTPYRKLRSLAYRVTILKVETYKEIPAKRIFTVAEKALKEINTTTKMTQEKISELKLKELADR